ncbi:MAG TPA: UDP-2,3-diacylglucosamine diphosphatase LpxI [bacterium]|nr:UDP-2,3-diacylglucosamine diphosphatase LpxI [bacterium]
MTQHPSPTVGLIAGSGDLPLHFIRQARAQGRTVITAAIRGAAASNVEKASDHTLWMSAGQLGTLLSYFKKQGVRQAVMQGKLQHADLFKNLRLDWKALSLWTRLEDRSGESVLKAVAGELSKTGIRLLDARFLMKDLLAPKGWLAPTKVDVKLKDSITYGLRVSRAVSKLKIGQSIAVKKNAVVAVEGMEGTDEMIRRAGKLAGPGIIVVKTASLNQDWRFDVPTIGPGTIHALVKAKARGIVVESGKSFVVARESTLATAGKNKIFIQCV